MADKELSNKELRVPAFCPICGGLMKGKSTFTFYDFGCCVDCFVYFIEGRAQKWRDGWRPSPEEMERFREMMKD